MPERLIDFISGVEVKATPEEVEAVQPFAHRLVEDFGYPKNQISTHPQHRIARSPSDETQTYPVDIAIFASASKRPEQLQLLVECKQKKRSDGIKQLKHYLDLCPATLGVWFNGEEHCYLRKFVDDRGVNAYEELPTIPRFGQRVEDIGRFLRRDLIATHNLKTIFKDLRNYIAGNATGITRDETIAAEIINVLFCKIYDELNTAPDELLTFRYGVDESAQEVVARIQELFRKVQSEYSDVFEEEDRIHLDDRTLPYVVGELQPFCVTDAERDAIGDAFEVFIGPALKGSQGQFFTPRNIVRTAVTIVDPGPDDRILDPACGSGGFLVVALEHVWDKLAVEAKDRGLGKSWLRRKEDAVAQDNIFGIEKDSFLAKITKAYMAIIGDGRGGIFCENSLLSPTEWSHEAATKVPDGEFDIVLTNPPFGAKITISDPDVLKYYDLGYKWVKDRGTGKWTKTTRLLKKQAPQLLFIERCLRLLKEGGRLGIVLPDGVLGGAKIGYVPHYIESRFDIIASVDCPLESFSPNTTTKVHVMVLQKKKAGESVDADVFMSVPQIIGHDRKGHPIYRPSSPDALWDDLEETRSRWERFRGGKLKTADHLGFSVRRSEMEESLHAKRYLPEFMAVIRRLRATKQPVLRLRDMAIRIATGANVDNLDYVDDASEGVPYILVKNVLAEGITFSNLKHIRKEVAQAFPACQAKGGDIVINRCGDAGLAVVIPKDYEGAVVCGFCFLVRLKRDYDPYYVTAYLNGHLGLMQSKRLAVGSILEHITKADLQDLLIVLPKKKGVIESVAEKCREATEYRQKARKAMETFRATFVEVEKDL